MAESPRPDDAGFERQNEQAIREAREADRIEPRANTAAYDPRKGLVLVELRSGFAFGFPPARVPGLESATAHELSAVRISPSGDGIIWDELDVQASLTGIMATALNLREWAPRFMGQIRSEAKAKASRANGLKGGRPPRSPGSRSSSKGATRR
jgi:hypothetical protein